MDPEANLNEQREIRRRIRNKETETGDYARLRELREAFAGWIRMGGFDPRVKR